MKHRTLLFGSILIIGFVVRLYHITYPIADWHSWRQADTSAVTRNFETFGFTPLVPRYNDVSNVQSGFDNPMGYRMVEFPVYNVLSYGVYQAGNPFGLSVEMAGRIVSIIASLGSIAFLYALGTRYASFRVGLLAAFYFAVLPYAVFYSRVILPEPLLVCCSLGMLWCIGNSRDRKNRLIYITASTMFGTLAFLIKPIAGLYLVPFAYIWYRTLGFSLARSVLFLVVLICMIVPFVRWRVWIQQFPEGIPVWQWLLNDTSLKLAGPPYSLQSVKNIVHFLVGYDPAGIRYRPAFVRWILWERLAKLITGYAGIFFLGLGVFASMRNTHIDRLFFIGLALGAAAYLVVFAKGNVQHDYYQVILMPVIVMGMALGTDMFLSYFKSQGSILVGYLLFVGVFFIMLYASWQQVKGYYWINNPDIITAGKAADMLLPKDAKVIAPYGGDTAFLYQTNRQGWPVGFEIEEKVKKGATHYVNTNVHDGETRYVLEKFTPLVETEHYVIVAL